MSNLSQKHRLITVSTSKGEDYFIASHLSGHEHISELYQYQVELWSNDHDVKQKDLVGKTISIVLNKDGKEQVKKLSGYVNKLMMLDVNAEGLRRYQAQFVPGLWFTSLASQNRVFHKKSTCQIIEEVLADYSKQITFKFKLKHKYAEREYCVQFDETDFEFVSRLMAEEGMAYYFLHEQEGAELIIVDEVKGFYDLPEGAVEYDGGGSHPTKSTLHRWERQFVYHTGGFEFKDYCEFSPKSDGKLQVKSTNSLNDADTFILNQFGHFVFEEDKGSKHKFTDNYSKQRALANMEAIESDHEIALATSDCASFSVGGRFKLAHPQSSENGDYLIVGLHLSASDGNGVASKFENSFSAIPSEKMVRPNPALFRKKIHCPMVAKVVEMKATGAENSDDLYAQVKVQFPWNNKQNSCWVRVQQAFSGKNWGANFVPRKDQEVIVSFINGDLDRPIVTGAVYNGENPGPNYNATQSGWKTLGSGNAFNELRFDDKSGSEEIYMEAGKDHNFLVHNDQKGKIENDQILEVVNNRSILVIEGNEKHTIKSGNQTVEIDSGSQSLTISRGEQAITVKGAVKIKSSTSIELTVGSSAIKLTPNGIEIKGATLKAKGDATAEVKAGGILTMKGSLTKIN